jgi:hypothetical protein
MNTSAGSHRLEENESVARTRIRTPPRLAPPAIPAGKVAPKINWTSRSVPTRILHLCFCRS